MKPVRGFLFALMLLVLATVASAQDDSGLFSGERALEHVANHVSVGPRPTGTHGSIEAGNIILNYLDALGWETANDWHVVGIGDLSTMSESARQTFDVWQPLDYASLLEAQIGATLAESDHARPLEFTPLYIPIRNLVASTGSGETIIIGAHYDSRILSDRDANPENMLLPMPGANDGGSGVGVLLELARVISEHYTPNQEIRLVFFDAEDNGRIEPWTSTLPSTNGYLVGSVLYANGLDLQTENIAYMLLVDMVGDMDQVMPIEGYSNQVAPEIASAIWATAAELGYAEHFPTEVRSPITDDHVPFIQRGIPAVDIIDLDYPYWHTSEDTLDKVSADSLERVGRTLIAYLEQTGAITPKN